MTIIILKVLTLFFLCTINFVWASNAFNTDEDQDPIADLPEIVTRLQLSIPDAHVTEKDVLSMDLSQWEQTCTFRSKAAEYEGLYTRTNDKAKRDLYRQYAILNAWQAALAGDHAANYFLSRAFETDYALAGVRCPELVRIFNSRSNDLQTFFWGDLPLYMEKKKQGLPGRTILDSRDEFFYELPASEPHSEEFPSSSTTSSVTDSDGEHHEEVHEVKIPERITDTQQDSKLRQRKGPGYQPLPTTED